MAAAFTSAIRQGLSGALRSAKSSLEVFSRVSKEAKVKASANTMEQNREKLSTSAADLLAVATTYVHQVCASFGPGTVLE
jgi:hypothetical protein